MPSKRYPHIGKGQTEFSGSPKLTNDTKWHGKWYPPKLQKMQNDMKYNTKWHNMAQIDIKWHMSSHKQFDQISQVLRQPLNGRTPAELQDNRTLESFHEKRRRMNQKKWVVLKGGEKSFQKRGDGNLKETPRLGALFSWRLLCSGRYFCCSLLTRCICVCDEWRGKFWINRSIELPPTAQVWTSLSKLTFIPAFIQLMVDT